MSEPALSDDLPVDFFDFGKLRRSISNSNRAVELLVRFKNSLNEEMVPMQEAWISGDMSELQLHAHRIAAAAHYLGITGIGVPAVALNNCLELGRSGDEVESAWYRTQSACNRYASLSDVRVRSIYAQGSAASASPCSMA